MEPQLTMFDQYSSPDALKKLIPEWKRHGSLSGVHIVITGKSRILGRERTLACFEGLRARTSDSSAAVSGNTVVLVNRYASCGWINSPSGGTKLKRAIEKGAKVFPLGDFLAELLGAGFELPYELVFMSVVERRGLPSLSSNLEFQKAEQACFGFETEESA